MNMQPSVESAQGDQRQEAVLHALEQLILEKAQGDDVEINVVAIMSRTELPRTTFYSLFDGQGHAMSELITTYLGQLGETLMKVLLAEPTIYHHPGDVADALIDHYVEFMARTPAFRHIWVEREMSPLDRRNDEDNDAALLQEFSESMVRAGFLERSTPESALELTTYWRFADRRVNDSLQGYEGQEVEIDTLWGCPVLAGAKRLIRAGFESESSAFRTQRC